MKLKIPPEVQVGGHVYSIALSPDLKDSDCHAAVNHRLLLLLVNADRPESQKVEGLGHELIHIIDDVYDCDLEETQINRMAQGLFQVFSQLGIEVDWSEVPVKRWEVP